MYISNPPSQLGALKRRVIRSRIPARYPVKRVKVNRYFAFGAVTPPFKAPPGTEWVYEVDGLSGLGKFKLKKVLKKVVKVAVAPIKAVAKVTQKLAKVAVKVAKSKVGRIALIGAGAYFAAPWFISLASKIGTAAATLLVKQHAPVEEIPEEQAAAETAGTALPDWIVKPAQAYLTQQVQAQLRPSSPAPVLPTYTDQVARAEMEVSPEGRTASVAAETPAWVIPAAIGGAALLLLTTMS